MLKVKILMSPQILWMRIFEDFKEILRDAIFRTVGDFIPAEQIFFDSEYREGILSSKVVVRMYWKRPQEPSPILRKSIADYTLSLASEFIRVNIPNTITDVKIYPLCKES